MARALGAQRRILEQEIEAESREIEQIMQEIRIPGTSRARSPTTRGDEAESTDREEIRNEQARAKKAADFKRSFCDFLGLPVETENVIKELKQILKLEEQSEARQGIPDVGTVRDIQSCPELSSLAQRKHVKITGTILRPSSQYNKNNDKDGNYRQNPKRKSSSTNVIEGDKPRLTKMQLSQRWLIDSGASNHVISDKKLFTDFEEIDSGVNADNGIGERVKGKGDAYIPGLGLLKDILYVPGIDYNLLATLMLSKDGHIDILFSKGKVYVTYDGESW
ncbi:hypothetical protein E2320_001889 [Naja naja]|nr:hypothetical protein E2320_001889 [Naja naja]